QLQLLGHEVSIFAGFPVQQELTVEEQLDDYFYERVRVRRFRHPLFAPAAQPSIVEAEYKNILAAVHFREFLEEMRPDIVHFFHLKGLSGSLIETCHQLGYPTVLTP